MSMHKHNIYIRSLIERGLVTREVALQRPAWTYWYAWYIQCGEPSDETRAAVLEYPEWSWSYARYIDQCPRADTRATSYKSEYYKTRYIKEFGE